MTESILQEAERIVNGARQEDYDAPEDNFERIAGVWNMLLQKKLLEPITAEEVALLMIGLKVVRHAHRAKRDNLVDIAGYAECAARCMQKADDWAGKEYLED